VTIQKKLYLVIGGLFGLGILLIVSMVFSSKILVEQLKSFESSALKVENNQAIVIAHERFMGDLCRTLSKGESYSTSSTHETCILGKWLYPFMNSNEYKELSNDLQLKFNKLESSHEKLHNIAIEFKNSTEISEKLRNDIINTAPMLFKDVMSALDTYSQILKTNEKNILAFANKEIYFINIAMVLISIVVVLIGL